LDFIPLIFLLIPLNNHGLFHYFIALLTFLTFIILGNLGGPLSLISNLVLNLLKPGPIGPDKVYQFGYYLGYLG